MNDSRSILNAFKQKFSTTVNSIYINSLDRDVKFREVSVNEQKSLSKTLIENEKRKDITYDAQCALINSICLENDPASLREQAAEKGLTPASKEYQEFIISKRFDIYKLTEFDRIKLLIEVYQSNYFKKEIEYTCKECHAKNKFTLDFSKISKKLDDFDISDKIFEVEDKDRKYKFTIGYPNVQDVSDFYKKFNKKHKNVNEKEQEIIDNLSNMEYINLYIKKISMISKDDSDPNDVLEADRSKVTDGEDIIGELISIFPQNIIFSDENGLVSYISKNFIEKINNVFSYEKCPYCGALTNEGIGSTADFF